jgi:head-tail adaptor
MIQFNVTVNILRVTKSATGAAGALGSWTESSSTLHENLPCRINWKRGSEKIFLDKNTYFRDVKLYCRVVDVTVEDRVQYGSTIYQIVDVSNVDEAGRLLVLDLKLVQ